MDIEITQKYESCEVVEVKVAGRKVIEGLLEEFIPAIIARSLLAIRYSLF